MAGSPKHKERSHRSYHDKEYRRSSGMRIVQNTAVRKRTLFQGFKDALARRKQSRETKGEA